jgi:hypothetical protein
VHHGAAPHAAALDVAGHVHLNDPWQYKLSDLSYEPAVILAVENIAAEEQAKGAA